MAQEDEQENRRPAAANVDVRHTAKQTDLMPVTAVSEEADADGAAGTVELSVTEEEVEIERQFWAAIQQAKERAKDSSELEADYSAELRLQTDFGAVQAVACGIDVA